MWIVLYIENTYLRINWKIKKIYSFTPFHAMLSHIIIRNIMYFYFNMLYVHYTQQLQITRSKLMDNSIMKILHINRKTNFHIVFLNFQPSESRTKGVILRGRENAEGDNKWHIGGSVSSWKVLLFKKSTYFNWTEFTPAHNPTTTDTHTSWMN